jgi:transcriptional regulator with XRE-family HTH domain
MLPDHSNPAASTIEAEVVHRLQQLRREKGSTQQEVYDATGIHIARLEARRANMTINTLASLCRFYGIPLAEFFRDL